MIGPGRAFVWRRDNVHGLTILAAAWHVGGAYREESVELSRRARPSTSLSLCSLSRCYAAALAAVLSDTDETAVFGRLIMFGSCSSEARGFTLLVRRDAFW